MAVQAVSAALVAGWFATGHASAPDDGLLQLGVLSLSERVPGVSAVDGRPTMVVVQCGPAPTRRLDEAYGLVVRDDAADSDAALAERLALHRAVTDCQAGYVLLDGDSVVRYRSYDPGWPEHSYEQEVLLGHLDRHG